jgi:hypothetical protein
MWAEGKMTVFKGFGWELAEKRKTQKSDSALPQLQ